MRADAISADARTQSASALAGHTRISSQALSSLARAAAASALGVPATEVRVTLNDDDGLLALAISAPINVPPLSAVLRDPSRVQTGGGSVLERARRAKEDIIKDVTRMSGSHVSRVDIRLSGARIKDAGRVR
ncbi:hypothetical protein ACQR35_08770 [Pseudarthrobacter sp. J1738]|uniref:hypothetical protein n=1 Tax=unclassified Pseudarthrobacter TaxID=2647000 RepID=UPI003D2D35D5